LTLVTNHSGQKVGNAAKDNSEARAHEHDEGAVVLDGQKGGLISEKGKKEGFGCSQKREDGPGHS